MTDEPLQLSCAVSACHCGGAPAEFIVGPFANGKEYAASEKCALMHLMAGYRSRKIRLNDK